MRYINKELPVFKDKGEAIVYRFLAEAYVGGCHYEGLDYANFRKPEYRKDFESLLREEQYNLCCYCMRNVSNSAITLEHIIPRACNEKNYEYYRTNFQVLHDHVILHDTFKTVPLKPQAEMTHYPHSVAYANLVVSCNGISEENSRECCMCNGPRGNDKIVPLMLLPDCLERVGYIKNGRMYSIKEDKEIADTITRLNLNYERLVEIRKIWYLIGKYECWGKLWKADSKIVRALIFCQLFEVESPSELPEKISKYPNNNFYWELLLQYKWFYGYYILYGQ